MSELLISFIIPAYNAAQYLKACIDSVYSLDLKGHDREVIVVNDGSEDCTDEVLELCRKEHEDLQIVSQENKGLSIARNVAMDMARGRYLWFVDADDEVDYERNIDALLTLLEDGKEDIIGIDIEQIDAKGKRAPYRRYVPIYNKVYAPAREFMRGRNLFPCAVSYLYRRQFIESQNLRFMPGVYHEDDEFVVRAFSLATSFIATDIPLYIMVVRQGSITTTTDKQIQQRKLRDIVKILKSLDSFALRSKEYSDCMRCKIDYIVVDLLTVMMRQRHTKHFQKEIIKALKDIKRFPMRWRWDVKYIAFNIYTRLRYLL